MKRRKENIKMNAKDSIVILSTKEYSHMLSQQNKHYRKMFMMLVVCAAYIYKAECKRRNMQDAIDILAKEIKELKATKGE